ncbi:hypothetical protein ELE36_04485 [Pseudolysobacter antarcticus]|uniref:Glycosyltransferase family 1 protein n=1 Tax=Pseudolysobacter antarcticus TaxID=2511995 RepID=A0A411HGR3_9GAMM|nr:hypothetical protein [Pseudolysobacter antarcticus]QBB69688.1 hypothetical protein ELE36_04485 [Pseudolysobacter antarcticus]
MVMLSGMLQTLKRLWFARRDARDVRAFVHERVGPAVLTYNPRHTVYVRAYYCYCVALFRNTLQRRPQAVHLVFGDYPLGDCALPLRRIAFQIEHTLVKPGGGDSDGAPVSATPLPHGEGRYLARLLHRPALVAADLVLDYSHANFLHLRDAGGFDDLLTHIAVIAPLLHEHCFTRDGRDQSSLTLFSDAGEGRRGRFLAAARARGLPIDNLKRCFDSDALQAQYRRTRVLVNVHRSDHNDTIEELRILPALQSGVIVVSEDGPLRHTLPYARFIVWTHYDMLVEQVASVLRDYDIWHARLFGDPELPQVLACMAAANRAAIDATLERWADAENVDGPANGKTR